jgi:hypothetical protein
MRFTELILGLFRSLSELHPMAAKWQKSGHIYPPMLCTELILGPFQRWDQAASNGSKMTKKWSHFFPQASHRAHSWSILKLRVSCIQWQQNDKKLATVLSPCFLRSSFLALFEAETELHPISAKMRKKHRAFLGAHYSCIIFRLKQN